MARFNKKNLGKVKMHEEDYRKSRLKSLEKLHATKSTLETAVDGQV